LVGCGASKPDRVELSLAPDVISSQSGTLVASGTVLDKAAGLLNWTVHLTVDYTDRNGVAHAITDATDKSDAIGALSSTFTGLTWEGAGTVTASVLDDKGNPALDPMKNPVTAKATFSVVDQSPPTVTITSPAAGTHIPKGRFSVTASATDEIGVSQLFVQAVSPEPAGGGGGNQLDRTRSTILASGNTTGTVTYEFDAGNLSNGTTVTLYAMAEDMSGNLAVAASVNVVVDITIPAP
jgi:hypothetical protein